MAALVARLPTVPQIRRVTAVTGADNAPSRRLLERQGFELTDQALGTGEVRYTLGVNQDSR